MIRMASYLDADQGISDIYPPVRLAIHAWLPQHSLRPDAKHPEPV